MKKGKTGKKSEEGRVAVLLEDIEKKFDLVLEGNTALDVKFEKKFALLLEGSAGLDVKFEKKFAGLEATVEDFSLRTEANFRVIREYLSRIDDEIHDLKKKLDKKADVERLLRLEERVAKVELVVKKFYGKEA